MFKAVYPDGTVIGYDSVERRYFIGSFNSANSSIAARTYTPNTFFGRGVEVYPADTGIVPVGDGAVFVSTIPVYRVIECSETHVTVEPYSVSDRQWRNPGSAGALGGAVRYHARGSSVPVVHRSVIPVDVYAENGSLVVETPAGRHVARMGSHGRTKVWMGAVPLGEIITGDRFAVYTTSSIVSYNETNDTVTITLAGSGIVAALTDPQPARITKDGSTICSGDCGKLVHDGVVVFDPTTVTIYLASPGAAAAAAAPAAAAAAPALGGHASQPPYALVAVAGVVTLLVVMWRRIT